MANNPPYELIALLSDGEFHSGEAIGETFGISRSAIWKQLKKLSDLGIQTESIKGKGYRIIEPFTLLSKDHISNALHALLPEADLSLLVTMDSTNEELNRRIFKKQTIKKGDLVICEQQTAGKGRRGRDWQSPFAKNIYMSMAWSFDQGLQKLDGLSLVVGLAVAETLRSMGVKNVGLKWPNDVMVNNQKIAGILLEVNGDPLADCLVVVGVGINVNMRFDSSNKIDQPWVALTNILGRDINRNKLFAPLLAYLVEFMQQFEREGFAPFKERWNSVDWLKGQSVAIKVGNNIEFGQALGIDKEGAIVVENEGRQTKYTSGEISIRRRSM